MAIIRHNSFPSNTGKLGNFHQNAIGHSMVLTFRVHYIRIKSLLFWDGTPFWDFLPPKYCSSGSGQGQCNGTSNSSNTDVVEKVNLLVAASQHWGTSVAEGSP